MSREAGGREGGARLHRPDWLGHPALLLGVVVLVLNDHVLKARYPGWWTGKLSDFAGLAVVGIVLAAIAGRARGLLLAALAFTALKLLPGVAEAAAPWLGGVTRRDATDLIALTALVAVWFALRRERESNEEVAHRTETASTTWMRVRVALVSVAPIVGIVFTAAATSATSCSPRQAVVGVAGNGGDLYALVATDDFSRQWARSADGGRTWSDSGAPGNTRLAVPRDLFHDPGPTGPQKACDDAGTCWVLRDRRIIERVAPDGTTTEELRLTDAEFAGISTGCAGGSRGTLASIAAADGDDTPAIAASLGADGVLVRHADGRWERRAVLAAPPAAPNRVESAAKRALIFGAPVLALVVWLVGRRRSWAAGLIVAGAGWLATWTAAGALSFVLQPDTDSTRVAGRVAIVGIVVTTVAAIVVARRPRQAGSPSTRSAP
jgi:hypothetical protein